MSKYAVVYWSGTGNTEKMAFAVAEGIRAKGAEVGIFHAAESIHHKLAIMQALRSAAHPWGRRNLKRMNLSSVPRSDAAAFGEAGCPVRILWLGGWRMDAQLAEEVEQASCNLIAEGLIANNEPDEDALAACRALGEKLAG